MPVVDKLTKNRLKDYAKQQLNDCKGKLFNYRILDADLAVINSGICSIEDIQYDELINNDVYTIKDINTQSSFIVDFFHILVEEKKD